MQTTRCRTFIKQNNSNTTLLVDAKQENLVVL